MVYVVNANNQLISGYLDGEFIQTVENDYTTSCANSDDVYVGFRPRHYLFYKGYIDDIVIYNYALSEQEVMELYHLGGWGQYHL